MNDNKVYYLKICGQDSKAQYFSFDLKKNFHKLLLDYSQWLLKGEMKFEDIMLSDVFEFSDRWIDENMFNVKK